jgi:hypothetical protein
MKTISLKVPLIPLALIRAAEMLHGMAADLEGPTISDDLKGSPEVDNEEPPAERNAAEIFTEKKPADSVTGQEVSTETTTSGPAPAATTTNTIELDDDRLPWDHRINSLATDGSHPKLKKTNTWKLKRGINPVVVERVQAELRTAMAVPGPDTDQEDPAAIDDDQKEPAVVWTFPTLMAAITAAGFEPHTVLTAVQKSGLLAVPLLAARPDLVPAVAAELGL